LKKTVLTPSGEKVDVDIAFGVEFFRVFFWLQKIPIRRILCSKQEFEYLLDWVSSDTYICS
jgi:hypothetical protein